MEARLEEVEGEGELASELPVSGVRGLDHTADVGIEVEAPELAELFRRAARGTLWMVLERIPEGRAEERRLEVTAEDLPALLRAWLTEILYWQEVEGFCTATVEIHALDEGRIVATASGGRTGADPIREIKGVTWHDLVVEERKGGWYARVIFDV